MKAKVTTTVDLHCMHYVRAHAFTAANKYVNISIKNIHIITLGW